MNIAFAHPWALILLLLALLPFLSGIFRNRKASWNRLIPASDTTRWISRLIRFLGVVAFTGIVLGLAGMYQTEKTFTRTGTGAHIVFVLDRSASMNETFGGKVPDDNTP